MNTIEAIKVNYSEVTNEMIGACTKVIGADGKGFWKVANSRGDVDGNGNLIEYKVWAIQVKGNWHIVCNCEAGKEGKRCWHKRAAMAAEAELKTAMAEQVAANEAAKQVKRVETAKPQPAKKTRKSFDEGEALYQSRMRGIADILAAKRMAGLK